MTKYVFSMVDLMARLGHIAAWFKADDIAGLEYAASVAIDVRLFMDAQADRVAAVVDESRVGKYRMFADHLVHRPPELGGVEPGTEQVARAGLDAGDVIKQGVLELRGSVANEEHTRQVGPVAAAAGPGIDDVKFAGGSITRSRAGPL